jgi:hypothetical protein
MTPKNRNMELCYQDFSRFQTGTLTLYLRFSLSIIRHKNMKPMPWRSQPPLDLFLFILHRDVQISEIPDGI